MTMVHKSAIEAQKRWRKLNGVSGRVKTGHRGPG
jgi:hypothetical protein